MTQPIQIAEITGGIRRTATRVFPPNGLKKAENIIASINDSIFETAPPINDLLDIISGNIIQDAIVHFIDEERIFYVYIETGSGNFIVKGFGDTPITLGNIGIVTGAKLSTFNGELLVHSFLTAGGINSARHLYKEIIYTRVGEETIETGFFEVPALVDPALDELDAFTTGSELPVLLAGSTTGFFSVFLGYQINGFESIIAEVPGRRLVAAVENIALKIDVSVPTSTTPLVSSIDIYLANSLGLNPDNKNLDYMFVDTISMDYDEVMLEVNSVDFGYASDVITMSIPGDWAWEENQWKGFMVGTATSSVVFRIVSNTKNTITIFEGPGSLGTFTISSQWYLLNGKWRITYFIGADEGEALIDRTGYGLGTIRYLPYANFIENFKGFIWLADFLDDDDKRQRSRLINNVINFDGQSCYNVFNTNIFSEFQSPILGMKAFDDYMLIICNDGVYALRFQPAQSAGAYSWAIKKISTIKISSYKYITGDGNNSFLFDGKILYACDGHVVKPLIDTEQQVIIEDQTTPASILTNDYSLAYNPRSSDLYLIADNVIRFKGGLFFHTLESVTTSQFVGIYKKNPVFFTPNIFREIKDVTTNLFATTFDFEMHQTDMGSKEDKYFVHALLNIFKGSIGEVVIKLFLNDTLITTVTLPNETIYDEYLNFVIPKDQSRRFKDMYFKIQCTSGFASVEFRLKTMDIEVDPVRHTMIEGAPIREIIAT